MIVPYWCDIHIGNGGNIWYSESINQTLLTLLSEEIKLLFPEFINFKASWIFTATWNDVAFYGADADGQQKVSKNSRFC